MNGRGFWLRHLAWPALLLVLLAVLLRQAGLDFAVANAFFDPTAGAFPAREAAWAELVMHRGGRYLIVLVALAALGTLVAGLLAPAARPLRRGAGYVLLCLALGPGLVALGKKLSSTDCPWDLQRYGGERPFVGLLEPRPAGLPAGHCFPGGHSSGAFALFAFYFLARRYRPRLAPAALASTVVLGLAFAVTQWARGAHFPSHDLWSAAIGWYASLALAWLCLRSAGAVRARDAGLAAAA